MMLLVINQSYLRLNHLRFFNINSAIEYSVSASKTLYKWNAKHLKDHVIYLL